MRCEVFNVGRATHWAFADGLGVNPKADPVEGQGKQCTHVVIFTTHSEIKHVVYGTKVEKALIDL